MIAIRVPATSANLGSGFDALGVALTLYNTVYFEESDHVDIVSLDDIKIPVDSKNLIYSSAAKVFELCGKTLKGLRIRQINDIPMTRGLGSSSACLVAGLLGANTLLGHPLTKDELCNLACALEGHPDNVTPALLGGLVTSAMDEGKVHSVSVPVAQHVRFCAIIPDFMLPTAHARAVLPKEVTRKDAVYNLSRAALMTSSLFSGNLENLEIATQDRLHQPYRMGLIKGAQSAFRIAREHGAYGVYISGAGPTIMAMIDEQNRNYIEKVHVSLMKNGIFGWDVKLLSSDAQGAYVYQPGEQEEKKWR